MFSLRLPRRDFLLAATAPLGGLIVGLPTRVGLAAPKQQPVYRLEVCGTDCVACNACAAHAEHKYFATAAAADEGRAHPYCNCTVVAASLPHGTWVSLFGHPRRPRRLVRDSRDRSVAAALGGR